jgi:hypothetical protein
VTILVVVGAISLVLLSSGQRLTTTSSTTPSESTCTISSCYGSTSSGFSSVTAFHSTVSSGGLELRIYLSATTIASGGGLAANITLFNPLNENLSLIPRYPANSIMELWDNYDFVCGADGDPLSDFAGFAVLKGHFSADNISQAPAPLQLAATPGPLACGGVSSIFSPEKVVFLPGSNRVLMYEGSYPAESESVTLNATTESCAVLPGGSSQCHGNTGLFGYWNTSGLAGSDNSATNSKYFNYFAPGEYTLAVEDIWNQTGYAYFHVIPGPNPASVVSGMESPFSNPGEPVIGITLANFGDIPITSLNAILPFVPLPNSPAGSGSYSFAFNVNSSSPLLPGQTIQETRTFVGPSFDIGVSYPLTITGMLGNGTEFAYTQQVQFVNSVPVW